MPDANEKRKKPAADSQASSLSNDKEIPKCELRLTVRVQAFDHEPSFKQGNEQMILVPFTIDDNDDDDDDLLSTTSDESNETEEPPPKAAPKPSISIIYDKSEKSDSKKRKSSSTDRKRSPSPDAN